MPCRHADSDDGDVDRENFAKTALVLGGPRAIRTAIDREGTPELPASSGDAPERSQHDWTTTGGCPAHGETVASSERAGETDGSDGTDHRQGSDGEGCPVDHADGSERGGTDSDREARSVSDPPSPRYHLLSTLSFDGSPTEDDREAIETALSSLVGQFGWGPSGVLVAVGYAPSYFERFEGSLPRSVRADPAFAREVAADGGCGGDVSLHLASDDARLLLAAEEALWNGDPVLDVDLEATLSGVFERPREPPARRAAVATGEGVAPDGQALIEGGSFGGGAVQRIAPVDDEVGGCPAHSAIGDANLLSLGPEGSTPLSVEFGAPDPEGSSSEETYLVPPQSARSLPVPGNR